MVFKYSIFDGHFTHIYFIEVRDSYLFAYLCHLFPQPWPAIHLPLLVHLPAQGVILPCQAIRMLSLSYFPINQLYTSFNTSQLLDIRKLCIPKDGPANNKNLQNKKLYGCIHL